MIAYFIENKDIVAFFTRFHCFRTRIKHILLDCNDDGK